MAPRKKKDRSFVEMSLMPLCMCLKAAVMQNSPANVDLLSN